MYMENNKGLVSVAIPAYKVSYLKEAIQSVLSQTYSNIELIIVNDQSPEDIDSIVNQFNDNRIRYYVNPQNIGRQDPVANWNKCLSYARGTFFALLCDDDLYDPCFIETMLSLANKYPQVNVFRSRGKIINNHNHPIDYYPSSPEFEKAQDYMWHVFKRFRMQTISEFFYRREYIQQKGGYLSLPLAWNSDYLSIFNFSMNRGIVSTSYALVSFRMSGMNISSITSNTLIKIQADNLMEQHVNQLIHDSDWRDKELLYKLLHIYIKQQKTWELSNSKIGNILTVWSRKKKYMFSNKSLFAILLKKIVQIFYHLNG